MSIFSAAAYRPLRHQDYRSFWFCALAVYLTNFMHQVGAAAIMATITTSSTRVALVQTVATLPSVLLSLPAGALVDQIDRRRWFQLTQSVLLTGALLAIALVLSSGFSPDALLLLTFFIGVGYALHSPAALSVVAELVPPEEMREAIVLGSAAFNLARVLGPVLAALGLALVGGSAIYAAVAASSVGMLIYVFYWKPPARVHVASGQGLLRAMLGGLRYFWQSPNALRPLQFVFVYTFCGSAVWALLAVVARDVYHSINLYGLMMGALGLGGVVGVLYLPNLKRSAPHRMVGCCLALFACVSLLLSMRVPQWLCLPALSIGGAVWVIGVTQPYAVLQDVVPPWVRGRAVSVHGLCYFGGMSGGGLAWGLLAENWGLFQALDLSAVACLAGALWFLRNELASTPNVKSEPA